VRADVDIIVAVGMFSPAGALSSPGRLLGKGWEKSGPPGAVGRTPRCENQREVSYGGATARRLAELLTQYLPWIDRMFGMTALSRTAENYDHTNWGFSPLTAYCLALVSYFSLVFFNCYFFVNFYYRWATHASVS